MGTYIRLKDLEEGFLTGGSSDPVIVNDFDESSGEARAELNNLIYTTHAGDVMSSVPSCECRETTGGIDLGEICDNCGKPVKEQIDQELEPLIWLRRARGVAKLMIPIVWMQLNKSFTRAGFKIIQWLCDPTMSVTNKQSKMARNLEAELQRRNIRRGYNNFVERFDEIIDILFTTKGIKPPKKQVFTDPTTRTISMSSLNQDVYDMDLSDINGMHPLQLELAMYRDRLFSDYVPVPNRSLLVMEKSNGQHYVEPIDPTLVEAVRLFIGIDTEVKGYSERQKENRTVKVLNYLSMYYECIFKDHLATKRGLFRRHVFASRSHFSFRAVISSLTGRHRYDEVHIPWGVAVNLFEVHLSNILMGMGWSSNEILDFLREYSQQYHPLLDALFQQIIKDYSIEYDGQGVAFMLQRNPSLQRGSAQFLYITKVKTDVDDPTISMSILACVGFNADFDGDELNGMLAIDNFTAEQLEGIKPHKSTFSLKKVREVTGNLSMPKPAVATISDWVRRSDLDVVTEENRNWMAKHAISSNESVAVCAA